MPNPFGPDEMTYRVTTHTPTGDLVLVQKMDFRDGVIVARRVVETFNGHVRKSDVQTLPITECAKPYLMPRNAETVAALWDSGVRAVMRDAGQVVQVRTTRHGNKRARVAPMTAADMFAEAEKACARGAATLADEWMARAIELELTK